MSTNSSVLSPQFDVGTAALEHLELLNRSNLNPLEIAAQFRTLLRSKRNSSNIEYTYLDYIAADATYRRRARSRSQIDYRSKSLGKIQYDQSLPGSHSSYSHFEDDCSIEDFYTDSAVGSDSSDRTTHKSQSSDSQITSLNPTVNWKQIREKENERKLDATRTCSTNRTELRETFEQKISSSSPISRSRCSSYSIRTPSISPIHSPRPSYTISRLNLTSMNDNNHEDILFPIADCNLVIRHKAKKLSQSNGCTKLAHFEDLYNKNKLFCRSTEDSGYL